MQLFCAAIIKKTIEKCLQKKLIIGLVGQFSVLPTGSKPAKISNSVLQKLLIAQLMYTDFGKKLPRHFFKLATTCKEPILAKLIILHENLLSIFGKESESACLDIESGPSWLEIINLHNSPK